MNRFTCMILMAVFTMAGSSSPLQAQGTAIRLNQVGFYPGCTKQAVVLAAEAVPFSVIVSATMDTVFRGTLGPANIWGPSNENVRTADFSSFTMPGTYYLHVSGIGNSYPFRIASNVHQTVGLSALKGYYYQRASTTLPVPYAGIWFRPSLGHPDTSVIIHPSAATSQRPAGTTIAAPYGWYDAGDYNKYVVNSGISTYTLLATYEMFPAYCTALASNIPESGNSLPDVLDEALWNLRWLLAMQDPGDGGVYAKLTNQDFDGWILPWAAKNPRYVVMKSTAATLDFAAVMAQASRIFRNFPDALPGFADTCLNAAFNAWNWAKRNPAIAYDQTAMNAAYPTTAIHTGEYGDNSFQDERDWAGAELYVTTRADSFMTGSQVMALFPSVPNWGFVRTLGLYSLAAHRTELTGIVDTTQVRARILSMANTLRSNRSVSAYQVAMGGNNSEFVWGSNSVAANQGMALLFAYRLSGDSTYLQCAVANLDYLLGRNAMGYCFLTGAGSRSPQFPHHRISQADPIQAPVPGLLVGGPNPGQEDLGPGVVYPSSLPACSYIDVVGSYASNEIAINWNAPFVFLTIGLEASLNPGGVPTGVSSDRIPPTPRNYNCLRSYPNPFNPSTVIDYELIRESPVRLTIFDLLGREVAVLVDGHQPAGVHRVTWNAAGQMSGMYVAQLSGTEFHAAAKLVLMK